MTTVTGPAVLHFRPTLRLYAAQAARALALRRVLREADRPLTVEAVARRFRRAPRAAVADLLNTLASLGQTRRVDNYVGVGDIVSTGRLGRATRRLSVDRFR